MNFGFQNVPQGLDQNYFYYAQAPPNRAGMSFQYTYGCPAQVAPYGQRPPYAMNFYGPVPRNFIKVSPNTMTGNFNSGVPFHRFISRNVNVPKTITNHLVYYQTEVPAPTQQVYYAPVFTRPIIRPPQKMSFSEIYASGQKGVIKLEKKEVPQFCCPHGITKCLLLEDPCFVPPRQVPGSGPRSPEKKPSKDDDASIEERNKNPVRLEFFKKITQA